jgi:hypothetical protein
LASRPPVHRPRREAIESRETSSGMFGTSHPQDAEKIATKPLTEHTWRMTFNYHAQYRRTGSGNNTTKPQLRDQCQRGGMLRPQPEHLLYIERNVIRFQARFEYTPIFSTLFTGRLSVDSAQHCGHIKALKSRSTRLFRKLCVAIWAAGLISLLQIAFPGSGGVSLVMG